MTVVNRLPFPVMQLSKSDGTPASGWTLTFYLSGTSTLANVYTAVDLTGATNAIVLNSYGMPDVDIFLDPDVNYKLIITDDSAATVFTYNNVRDFARRAVAHFTIYAGNPNGNVAGTAGVAGGTPADAIFDTTNNIIWVCTTTGTAGTAVWTNVSSALSGATSFTGVLTPASFSTQQDNYNPTDLSITSAIRLNPGADSDITGLAGGTSGREITLINTSTTYRVVLRNQNTSSSVANRFLLPNDLDVSLLPNYLCVLSYDSISALWRLKVPPLAIPLGSGDFISNATFTCSVASSALTIALKTVRGSDPTPGDPVIACFRNSTVATGNYLYRTISAALSLVVSSGSKIGSANNVPFKSWVVLFDDGGTMRLGVINCVLGDATPTSIYPLGQVPIASSTAEGGAGGADSAQVFYTGAAVTSKPYVILGYFSYESGLATAGTWSAVPTRIQLFGQGVPLPGAIVQMAWNRTGEVATGSTSIPNDDTIPQDTEGDQYMSQAITPISATNLLEIDAFFHHYHGTVGTGAAALFSNQDSSTDALASIVMATSAQRDFATIHHKMLANTTTATTISLRAGTAGGATFTFNGSAGSRLHGGSLASYLSVKEIMT